MNRIKILRMKNKLKQQELSKIINVSQASLSGYESGKYEPDNKTLLNLAAFFGVTTDYLLGKDSVPDPPGTSKKIPVLRGLRAERSAESAKDVVGYEEISEEMARQGDFFAIKMHGDSMEPRIQDGDTVIVQIRSAVETGDIAVVSIRGDEATIKKIAKYESGITLIPYNPKYELVSFSTEDLTRLPVVILGKAVQLRGKC
ncbi:LexA family protein [Caproiciproducens sp. R2]|uniref:LexA family protein n=1 Tax=Caproiciproducens sp. R2 TaxID=3435187 RepID=UPI004034B206